MITLSVSVTNMWTGSLCLECLWLYFLIFCQFIFTVTTAHHKYCHRWLGNKSPNSTFTQRVKRRKVKRKCVRERRGLLLPQSGQRAAWHSCHGVYVIRHSVWKGGEGRGGYRFPPRQGWSQHTWRSEISLMLQLWISHPSSSTLQV